MTGPGKQPLSKTPAPRGPRKPAGKRVKARVADEWARARGKQDRAPIRKTLAALNNLLASEGGRPLGRPLRRRLEKELGQTLPEVRLHDSARARLAAMRLGARAFTLGPHIALSPSVHPASGSGFSTLLHEAAHVIQQSGAAPAAHPRLDPSPALERDARGAAPARGLARQAVQRQLAGAGPGPEVRFAQLASDYYQIIVGGVRIGGLRVSGLEEGSADWFGPAYVVSSTSAGHQVDIGLVHTPGITVEFLPRAQPEVASLLEARHISYPTVTDVPVPEGTTPEEMSARLLASADRLAHPPLTEMTLEAPEVRVDAPEIRRSRAPREEEPEAAPAPEREWSVGTMILQAVMGEWEEDPFISSILLDTGLGLIPFVDQAMDVRDVSAHLYFMIGEEQYTSVMRWIGLVFSLIGAVPEIGTAIKGASRILIRGGSAALSRLDELFALMRRFLPEGASLTTLRRYLSEHWDEWAALGRAAWLRIVEEVGSRLRALPDFVAERYVRILDEIRAMSPRMLDDAFAMVRREIDEAMAQIDELLAPHGMTPDGLGMPIPDSPGRGGDAVHMSSVGDGGGTARLDGPDVRPDATPDGPTLESVVTPRDRLDIESLGDDPAVIDRLSRAREFDIGGYRSLTGTGGLGRVGDGLDSDEAIQNAALRALLDVERTSSRIAGNPAMALTPAIHRMIRNLRTADMVGMTLEEVLRHHLDELARTGMVPGHVIVVMERESLRYIREMGL